MSITIKEVLGLENFDDFMVIAGSMGLANKVNKVGILDYETKEMIEKNFVEGEFVISTLLIIKDKVDELYEIVEKLILVGASGLAIKNIYFDTLPDEVIELANSKSFPIMIFSNIYFEDVITSVNDAINQKQEREVLALKIDNILYGNLRNVLIKQIAFEINRNFREMHVVAFCKRKNTEGNLNPNISFGSANDISFTKLNKIIQYQEGYLIIITFMDIDAKDIAQFLLNRLKRLGFESQHFSIGISSLYERIDELNLSIQESLYAYKYARVYQKDISFFGQIGVNKLLLPLIDNQWVQKYYEDMITPLLAYDRKNDTDLLKTAITYIENNGDIKATANELFQHSNTIRYRVDRISKILSKSCETEHFYEELAVAVRIHNLLKISL